MALINAFLQDPTTVNLWVAARTDGIAGSGTAQDPFNGSTKQHPAVQISLKSTSHSSGREAEATILSPNSLFVEGDIVVISGVTGPSTDPWNGTFGIYNVSSTKFNYLMTGVPLSPQGNPKAVRLTFPFDEVMRNAPVSIQIRLGPGTYQTRGFGANAAGTIDAWGWQPKTGQKIVGAGAEVTTLQLVGADQADYHYHAVGMSINPAGTTAIAPLESFEISDLSIDCNADNQPGRPTPGYAAVAGPWARRQVFLRHQKLLNGRTHHHVQTPEQPVSMSV